tara:strand:+ start:134 stop:808 length:675 start_codon:yes stop_codon:yes gene_type:complete
MDMPCGVASVGSGCGAGCPQKTQDKRRMHKTYKDEDTCVEFGEWNPKPRPEGKKYTKDARGRFHCISCGHSSKNQSSIAMHVGTHFPHEFVCLIPGCDVSPFRTSSILRNHYKNIHKPKAPVVPIKCELDGCSKTYKNKNGYFSHLSTKHLDWKKQCKTVDGGKFECLHCDKPLKKAGFLIHLARDHKDEAMALLKKFKSRQKKIRIKIKKRRKKSRKKKSRDD